MNDQQQRPVSTEVRPTTIVWGLVIIVAGAGVLGLAAGLQLDLQLALIITLCLAGAVLVVTAITSGLRRRETPRRDGGS